MGQVYDSVPWVLQKAGRGSWKLPVTKFLQADPMQTFVMLWPLWAQTCPGGTHKLWPLSCIVLVYEMGFCEKKPLGGSQEPEWVNTSNGSTVGGGLTTCPGVTTAALVEA